MWVRGLLRACRVAAPAAAATIAWRHIHNDRVATASRADEPSAFHTHVGIGITSAVGGTPLIEIPSLSAATGCRILAKCEQISVCGSVKDRPALSMIESLEESGVITPGGGPYTIIEATGGNTGIALALVCAARGYKCVLTYPANVAREKVDFMHTLGAETVECPVVPFSSPQHYYHVAARLAGETRNAVWTNQFENTANMAAHVRGTGPEIWAQSGGVVDAIVAAAGTGGTIAGLSTYLKEKNPLLKVFIIDPPGSSLLSYVRDGVMTSSPGATITEGIGIGRLTANFAAARVDAAFAGVDAEAVDMAWYLLRHEGIFVGPSAALNVCGAVKAARAMGPGHTIVTVLCDGGERYKSKLFDHAWLQERGFTPAVVPRGSIPHVA